LTRAASSVETVNNSSGKEMFLRLPTLLAAIREGPILALRRVRPAAPPKLGRWCVAAAAEKDQSMIPADARAELILLLSNHHPGAADAASAAFGRTPTHGRA